mgnify:CR=1 FL=1|tara:strand:+ start:798 stop:2090 length:1293 start_codon:yes stop_codon:yes gene_type:complete
MSNEILMPALSPTMEEGTLAKWLVAEGDNIVSGDLIAEIETDKATMEVESIYEGIIGKLFFKEGSEGIKVNTPIGIILDPGEQYDEKVHNIDLNVSINKEKDDDKNVKVNEDKSYQNSTENDKSSKNNESSSDIKLFDNSNKNRIFATPLAKRIANEKLIDLSSVSGSGPHGRIIKKDVENYLLISDETALDINSKIFVSGESNYDLVKNSSMRQTIAKRLVQSKTNAPHFYLSIDCNIDDLLSFRTKVNNEFSEYGKISVNDIIIKVAGLTLSKVPECNVSWTEESTKFYKSSDISVAVAIDGGLITPIIKKVENKGIHQISKEVKELVEKAKDGLLLPSEYNGGSFSISNLGMYGIKNFTAIINPPQSAILAVGAGQKVPIVKSDEVVISNIMNVTLSCDHRAIDGAIGAKFLQVFKKIIENPMLMSL